MHKEHATCSMEIYPLVLFRKNRNLFHEDAQLAICKYYHSTLQVFWDFPVSGLPDFLSFLSSASVGFSDFFVNENKIYIVRLFGVLEPEKPDIQNSYDYIYNLTRSQLIEDKITTLINEHKQKIYIKTFY